MTRTERRILTFGVALSLATALTISEALPNVAHAQTAERPTWGERFDRVRYRSLDWPRDAFSSYENRLSVHAAAVRFNVAEGYMICVVDRETGGTWNEFAYNSSSGASGLFQHLIKYWAGRVAAYRAAMADRPKLQIRAGVSPFNARANILVSARLMSIGQYFHWGDC